MARKSNKNEFSKKAKVKHDNKYDYSKVEYIKSDKKVCIICPIHGEFWQTPSKHLCGQGCSLCIKNRKTDTPLFIGKGRKKHGEKFDYSKVEYVGAYTPICIICPTHGEFYITPTRHIESNTGCQKCGRRGITSEDIVEEAKEIHGNYYDYSMLLYEGFYKKFKVICPYHGIFYTSVNLHISQGCGCPKCNTGGGYTLKRWIEKSKRIKNVSFKLYKIKLSNFNTKEYFYKIGITFHTVEHRFKRKKDMPYSYEVVELIESDDGEYIWNLEKELHRQHKEFKYVPKIEFGGMSECFTKLIENKINKK